MIKRTKLATKNVDEIDQTLQRMAISYIIDKGYANIKLMTPESIDQMYKKLLENESSGINYIISPELQKEIVETAKRITETFTPWEFLKYIQNEIEIVV